MLLHRLLSCSHFLFSYLNVFEDPLSSLRVQKQHVENCRSAESFPFGREQLFLSVQRLEIQAELEIEVIYKSMLHISLRWISEDS